MRLAYTICCEQRSQGGDRVHRSGEGVYERTSAVLRLRAQQPINVAGSQGFRGCGSQFLPAFCPVTPMAASTAVRQACRSVQADVLCALASSDCCGAGFRPGL